MLKDSIKLGQLPNLRKLLIPDPGYVIVDMDLDRADLQIVVWEADDKDLKYALKNNVDIHLLNASSIWELNLPVDELINTHPNYPNHAQKWKVYRHKAKMSCHAMNYGVRARKLAQALGITVHEAELLIKKWFGAHPGFLSWHKRIESDLAQTRSVTNKFGYRRYYFDRMETVFTKALAWTPQSTVAIVINKALNNISNNLKQVDLLLQVHDSLTFQIPIGAKARLLEEVKKQSLITIPYDDPLVIPVGFAESLSSWGDCK